MGALAKLFMPGKDPGGIWIAMALGIAGSIVATYLGQLIGWYQAGQSAGFIMSIAGAIADYLPRNSWHARQVVTKLWCSGTGPLRHKNS